VEGRRSNQTITGVVVSDKMDKTVVVLVNRLVRHPVYKKYIRRRAKFMAHDERNVAKMGDTVEIIASRPLSKLKRWRLTKILAHQA
jgi:small subunit ribosomal protein S17